MSPRSATARRPPWVLLLAGYLMLGYLTLPLLALLGALPASSLADSLGSPAQALGVSLGVASAATVADAVLGVPLGYWLAQSASRLRHLATAAVILPLAVPPVVGGLEVLLLLGPHGPIGGVLAGAGISVEDSLTGSVLAQMFVAAPFIVISARAAFGALDPSLADASRSLGAGPTETFWRVLLPAARGGLAAGLTLGWIRCLGEFGATAVVSYHPYTLPILTYVNLSGEGLTAAVPVGAISAAVGAVAGAGLLWLDVRQRRSRRPAVSRTRVPAPAHPLDWFGPPTPAPPQALQVRAVARLGSFELDVAFEAELGSVAILGPSGAGKSLTLRAIAGLLRPQVGLVRLGERCFLDTAARVDVPPESRRLGYVAQREALFEHLDAEGNAGFALRRLPAEERRRRVAELLAALELERVRRERPGTLSGGERQRLALARALAPGPAALLLDEPFSSVDTAVRRELRALVRQLHVRTGIPLVMVTHDRHDALDLADQVVVVEAGRVVQAGPIEDVFARPAVRSVASLVGIPNSVPVKSLEPAPGGRVRASTAWGDLVVEPPERPARSWELAIPADAVSLGRSGVAAGVVSSRPAAGAWRLRLRHTEPGAPILEGLVALGGVRPFAGEGCRVQIEAGRCHLMPAPAAAGPKAAGTPARSEADSAGLLSEGGR